MELKVSLLLNVSLRIRPLTFINEVLCLSGSPIVPRHLSFLWQVFTTSYVKMATPIHFIDGKCRMKYLKAGKSRKTCLTNCTRPISHHITPLVINGLGGGHTDTDTQKGSYVNRDLCIATHTNHFFEV